MVVARYDHQINITVLIRIGSGERAEHECDQNVWREVAQHVSKSIMQRDRSMDDLLERFEDHALGIRLKKTLPVTTENAAPGQCRQLALDSADTAVGPAGNLAEIKRFVGMRIKHGQDGTARLSKQNESRIARRTHTEIDCTRIESG
ncbi:MAG: hypothetical protein SGJ19_26010 [Planctomycetia bacterium]|nr:hypothetical protein [Planctomycetia bacterium]